MQLKFELTKESKVEIGVTFHRIQASKDFKNVKKGELGGWIEKDENLDQSGDAWVSGDAQVSGNARVYGNARVSGDAWVYGNAQVSGDAQVSGNAQVSGDAQVYGDAQVEKSPLLIQGTKHIVTECNGNIKIGCEIYSIKEWKKNYKEIGKKHGHTDNEIAEYYDYILLAEKRMIK